MTMKRSNKMEETSTTVEEYSRKMNKSVCYTRCVKSLKSNEGETRTSGERICARWSGTGDDEELRLGVTELQSAIFRSPKGVSTPQANRILH